MTPEDKKAEHNQFKSVLTKHNQFTDAQAEVLMQRIADRLGGHTHEEVKQMHPWPKESA